MNLIKSIPRIFKNKTILSAAILSFFAFFVFFHSANALSVSGLVTSAMSSIALVIIEFVGKLLIVLIEILIAIVQYNDFINSPAVGTGWILVRDVANMGFLLIFVAIAFATILGVEKYEWKRLLPKLLIMSIAINFSKTICGIIIDASQVVMMTFVNGFKDVAAGNLIRGFGVGDMLSLREFEKGEGITDSAITVASILAVILLVIAVITVGIIVIMFLLRVIYLWILIILSPLAFILSATPGAEGQFQKWWSMFIKYAMMGPLLAFFLWLSFSIMANVSPGSNLARDTGFTPGDSNVVAERTSAAISAISQSDQLLSYFIAIALLLMSLMFANSLGVAGGSMAGTALAKMKSGGIKLATIGAAAVATGGVAGGLLLGTKIGRRKLDDTLGFATKMAAKPIKYGRDWAGKVGGDLAGKVVKKVGGSTIGTMVGVKALDIHSWLGREDKNRPYAGRAAAWVYRKATPIVGTVGGKVLHQATRPLRAVDRTLGTVAESGIKLRVIQGAWKARSTEREEERTAKEAGAMRDVFNAWIDDMSTNFAYRSQMALKNKKKKDIEDNTDGSHETLMHIIMNSPKGSAERQAAIELVVESLDMNEIVLESKFAPLIHQRVKEELKKNLEDEKTLIAKEVGEIKKLQPGIEYNRRSKDLQSRRLNSKYLGDLLVEMNNHEVMDTEMHREIGLRMILGEGENSARFVSQLGNISLSKRDPISYGLANIDPETGKAKFANLTVPKNFMKHSEAVVAKVRNMSPSEAIRMHPSSFRQEVFNKDGKREYLKEFSMIGRRIFTMLLAVATDRNLGNFRTDAMAAFVAGINIRNYPNLESEDLGVRKAEQDRFYHDLAKGYKEQVFPVSGRIVPLEELIERFNNAGEDNTVLPELYKKNKS